MEKNSKRSNLYKNQNFTKRITPQCSPMIILYVVNFCAHKIKTPCILFQIYSGEESTMTKSNGKFTKNDISFMF